MSHVELLFVYLLAFYVAMYVSFGEMSVRFFAHLFGWSVWFSLTGFYELLVSFVSSICY